MPTTGTHAAPWTEPFSALYWRIRVQSYLLAAALVCVAVLGVLLYRLGSSSASLVYMVAPDGEAIAVLDRHANRLPSRAESTHVARRFVSLFWGLNSSTVHRDAAEALSFCSPALAAKLREELASAQFVQTIRDRQIRSELSLASVEVTEHTEHASRVRVAGTVAVYALAEYDGQPIEQRSFDVELVLGVVPRDPHRRLNGLEVVRIGRPEHAPSSTSKPNEQKRETES
jgi:hypothetical protein